MSIKMVGTLAFLLISYLLWGGAAAIYRGHLAVVEEENVTATEDVEAYGEEQPIQYRRRPGLVQVVIVTIAGLWTFVTNSFVQLGNLPQMVPYMLKERQGYLMFCGAVLALTGLGIFGMSRLEKSLESGNPFSKTRQIRSSPRSNKKNLR